MTRFDTLSTPLGTLYVITEGGLLTGISFERPHIMAGDAPAGLKAELMEYFEGNLREFTQGFRLTAGTEFEKQVWLTLREIPYGETRPYKWLAQRVGCPKGARAIGQALSKNPIPIVLPCHRVVKSHGSIGGYSSGVDIKRRLLALEYYHAFK